VTVVMAHKFGGTSMGSAERIQKVADILLARDEAQAVVVSAMSGVTDALISLLKVAATPGADWKAPLEALSKKHRDAAQVLLGTSAPALLERFDVEFSSLRDLLHAQSRLGAVSNDLLDLVQGLGEVWSSLLLHSHFEHRGQPSTWVDAREVLVVEKTSLGAMVDWPASEAKLAKYLDGKAQRRLVITGFVARDLQGRITTLGRNGSDYSGAIFGALTQAKEIHIWTDVDGVLSADPRLVPEAVLLDRMSYSEACELAYFGAKVIHPQTMAPAIARKIPLVIRNTFAPEKPGTRVEQETDHALPVKGITTFSGLAMVNVEGAGLIGVPGTAERAFGALKTAGVSVVMISQGSSEHSICCVIQERDAAQARQALKDAFARELDAKLVHDITVTPGIAALAIVGDGMAGTPGVAARLFSALARAGINVRAIAQGASERNISVAIAASDATRALRAVHAGFYLSAQTLSIGLIGPGNVGKAFLKQVLEVRERLRETAQLDLRLRAVSTSKAMTLGENLSDVDHLKLDTPADLERFAAHVQAEHLPHAVIVDCSASSEVASHYAGWIKRGIHVITPNKQAGSGPWERYEGIRAALAKTTARFRYESTVGAGLPVLSTLRDLLDTGDEVRAIEGIFSGTLAYLFNRYDGTKPFSELVLEARQKGYTEPDPRDDLSGLDVARKLVILARELGWKTSLGEVSLETLVPEALRGVSTADFLAKVSLLDAPMKARYEAAKAKGTVLRYVAKLEAGGSASVGLMELPAAHPFAHIRLTDNVVQFTTRRYADNPLIVQGPGAGPDVTAAGVFADLLRIAAALGARV
jgi:aspartokinase/homoserine dehydrogenase 1